MALTPAQLTALQAAINAETDPTFVGYRNAGATGWMASWFNEASTFVVWKTSVPVKEVGDAINAAELAGLTALNLQRLQAMCGDLSGGFINPANADRRSGFDDVFSGAGGQVTRVSLATLWKRNATRGEKVFATGTGTTVAPGTLVYEGTISDSDVVRAISL
jgi:hypothetical protein